MLTCFLDLDGVLVDFWAGVRQVHGLGADVDYTRYDFWRDAGIPDDLFWRPLDYRFWAHLPWTPDGRHILAAVIDRFGREKIALLSKPCITRGCADGKREWCRRELPGLPLYLAYDGRHHVSHPGAVLIDDNDTHIVEWESRGGVGILVPRPWNIGRHVVGTAVNHVRECLSGVF